MDILLNNDTSSPSFNDAVFINGPLTLEGVSSTPAEVVAQRLQIRLQSFLGEWFINTAYGVPYWQRLLGKKINKTAVDRIFQEQILSERGVREITSFSSTLKNRIYEMSFRVRALDGSQTETISINTTL